MLPGFHQWCNHTGALAFGPGWLSSTHSSSQNAHSHFALSQCLLSSILVQGLAVDIETGKISLDKPNKEVSEWFQDKYSWDLLAARSVWAFGPDKQGPNVLLDDTLPAEVDKNLLRAIKGSITQVMKVGIWGSQLVE
jgi:hypothetical protein